MVTAIKDHVKQANADLANIIAERGCDGRFQRFQSIRQSLVFLYFYTLKFILRLTIVRFLDTFLFYMLTPSSA